MIPRPDRERITDMQQGSLMKGNAGKWREIFSKGGPRNHYPHSYVVSWYFKNVHPDTRFLEHRKVLDIGCGTAPDMTLFISEGFEYWGIDVTDECFDQILNTAESRRLDISRISLGLFSPPELPYGDNSFDAVIGLESLHFNIGHDDMGAMVGEIFRTMKTGGHFLFTTINKKHYFVVDEHTSFTSGNCLVIGEGFAEGERAGLRYHVFSCEEEIRDYFHKFAEVHVGEYLLDTCDNKPDAYYVIFGKK
ncbi:MAG TPA: class I SAM-dependent methyltransferase, partial [Thermodesulfovibrionales bacterium]|nr:class I SAM-dependent methyltransferase [Thermodesulfovibrionales bacterium]